MEDTSDTSMTEGAPRPQRAWAAVFVGSGVILAGLLLIVVANLSDPSSEQPSDPFEDIEELIIPPAIPEDIFDEAATSAGIDQDVEPMLERGAWIQVADEDGRLAQQYRCQSLSPNPEDMPAGWFVMERPEAEIYLSDGRVLLLTGDSGLAYAPHRRLEEGTLNGNVRIRVQEPSPDGAERATLLDVRTTEASFDSVNGQMRCPNAVEVRAERIDLDGRNMRLLFDDRKHHIRLRLEEVEEIVIVPETDAPAEAVAAAPPSSTPSSGVIEPDASRTTPTEAKASEGTSSSMPTVSRETFYVLSLSENVRIEEVDSTVQRVATGEQLRMIFTFESDGLSEAASASTETGGGRFPAVGSWSSRLALTAVATDPAPSQGRMVIRCDGPLTMEPVTEPGDVLASPRDTRLTLNGAPVSIREIEKGTTIDCAQVRYESTWTGVETPPAEIVRLIGTDESPFRLASDGATAKGSGFMLNLTDSTGRLEGVGTMTWRDPEDDEALPLRIDWTTGVSLVFHQREGQFEVGAIERATFTGDVHVDHAEFTLDAHTVTAEVDERPDGSTVFRTLHAAGDARALGLIEGESLRADDLRLEFLPIEGADSVPQRLLATGNVEALQARQTIWSDLLEIEFEPPAEGAEDADVDVRSVLAHGSVQVLLEDGTRAFSDVLEADARQRTAVLTGESMQLVQDRSVIDQSPRLTLDEASGLFTLEGRGRLRAFDRSVIDPDAVGRVDVANIERRADLIEDLRVTWTDGARFESTDSDRAGDATFTGNVAVLGRDLTLDNARTLVARFVELEGETVLDQIDAESPAETALDVVIRQVADGVTSEQRMWASTLNVVLEPDRDVAASSDDPESILVRSFTARNDVRLLLDDGTRIFADEVIGHPQTSTADLRGTPVAIVADNTLLRCGPDVRFVDHGESIDLHGGGRLTMFEAPVEIPVVGPFNADAVSGPTQLLATWTESATYVPTREDRTSVIDLRGEVHVDGRPDPLEIVRVDSDALTLEFEELASNTDEAAANASPFGGGDRQLSRLVAMGTAKLENVAWQKAEDIGQQDLARVFYVSGDHVLFNNVTGSARVAGAGELLVHDTWQEIDEEAGESVETPFASKGSTLFRWTDGLELRPTDGEVSEVAMRGQVQLLHRNLAGETATVTADEINATVERARDASGAETFDPGGEARLRHVQAVGNVFVRTTTRDVSCHRFDYHMDRFAELHARPGGTVMVRTRGDAGTGLAEHVQWDLVEDRITVFGAGGTSGQ